MAPETPDIRLLETMRVEHGQIALLPRHLERLSRSANSLGFSIIISRIQTEVESAIASHPDPAVLRLTVGADGTPEIGFRPAPPPGQPAWVRLSVLHANSADRRLYDKTTAREFYERARAGLPPEADALIANERGEITETTIANVAVLRDGRWITPPIECGLLGGVMRAELLARGEIFEGIIRADELIPGETIRLFNAVRGVVEAEYRKD
jgi:para-aminobenzoate synthetase/4-amino-4-deoxychorismate lyase